MTDREKLELTVGTELDFYINMSQQVISDKRVKTFISHIVVPRMMQLKAILGNYKEDKLTWQKRRELEEQFMKVLEE
jgi:hypothetical protein